MAGEGIEAVQQGLETMIQNLRRNPYALESTYLSLIAFSNTAVEVVPLTELPAFPMPKLKLRPGTALGAALSLLADCLTRDAVAGSAGQKGDYAPIVFLLTDGQPTDDWHAGLLKLKRANPQPACINVIGCGQEVDFQLLGHISRNVFRTDEATAEQLSKCFVWMTAGIQSASMSRDPASADTPILPAGIVRLEKEDFPPPPDFQRQIFLHHMCSRTRGLYLTRYIYSDDHGLFAAAAVHKLEPDFLADGTADLPPVPSEMLRGGFPCPYCASTSWINCGGCERIFCASDDVPEHVTCPSCQASLTLSTSSSFRLKRSAG